MNSTAWVGPERTARHRLRPDLHPYLALTRLAHSFSEKALELRARASLDSPAQIQYRLLIQASNQLRIVELSAERGYALQALGAAATLYEHVSALAYVDGDAEKAAQWLAHTDFERSYPPPSKRETGIRLMLRKSGSSTEDVEHLVSLWEDHHRRFCAAKHGNPILLKEYGVSVANDGLTFHLGPVAGRAYTLLSRLALYHGARLLADASVLLAAPMLTERSAPARRFRRARTRILARIDALASKGAA